MPPRRSGKKGKGASPPASVGDRLSDLPDDILHRILSCVLARRWRHLWKFATSLHIERELEDDPESLKAAREFVDHLLLLREATHIDTCDLFFIPYGDELQNDDAEARIKLWIRHILKCKTRVLGVRFPFSCIYEMTLGGS